MKDLYQRTFSFKALDFYKHTPKGYEDVEEVTEVEKALHKFMDGVTQLSYGRLVISLDEGAELGIDNCSAWDENEMPHLVIYLGAGLEVYVDLECTVEIIRCNDYARLKVEPE